MSLALASRIRCAVLFLLCLLPAPICAAPALTPPTYWADLGASAALSLPGDIDGDGRADLIAVHPEGAGYVEWRKTSAWGKPLPGKPLRARFGGGAVGAACGRFADGPGDVVLTVGLDGGVHVAWGFDPAGNMGRGAFRRDDEAARLPRAVRPFAPVQAVAADWDGDGRADVLLRDERGRLLFLRNIREPGGPPRFDVLSLALILRDARALAAARLEKTLRLLWLDASGRLFRAAVFPSSGGLAFGPPVPIFQAAPGDALTTGRLTGGENDDVLAGAQLLTGGDPARKSFLPGAGGAGAWIAGDLDKNGRGDLIHVCPDGAVFALFCHESNDGDTGCADSSGDGLLDIWKTGNLKPGGLDLKKLGCRIGRRDLIVEVQRGPTVSDAKARAVIRRAVSYFASLPIVNADGSRGIALHPIFLPPTPKREQKMSWRTRGAKYHPAARVGVTHWMAMEDGTVGMSYVLGQTGRCRPDFANFLHELGHQLGLTHGGGAGRPERCPLYDSVMNYCYMYDGGAGVGYSDGRLSHIALREFHLSKRLPVPPSALTFLARSSVYKFPLSPTPDGQGTWVDWNRDGDLSEADICADINFSRPRSRLASVGPSDSAPALARVGTHLWMAARTGTRLTARVWKGTDGETQSGLWSGETTVGTNAAGDPAAAGWGAALWTATRTPAGVILRPVTLDAYEQAQPGPPVLVPDSKNATPTLAVWKNALVVLLWRGPKAPVGLRVWNGVAFGPEQKTGLISLAPPGADSDGETLCAATVERRNKRGEWRVWTLTGAGKARGEGEWTDGPAGQADPRARPSLICEPGGRRTIFGSRLNGASHPLLAARGPDGRWKSGFDGRDLQAVGPPGACLMPGGDIVWAARQAGTLRAAFGARGLDSSPMADFDDIGFIRDFGLSRSLPFLVPAGK